MLSQETLPTDELCLDPEREENLPESIRHDNKQQDQDQPDIARRDDDQRDSDQRDSDQRDSEKYRHLADAFQSFSEVSNQLTQSYYELQNHVVSLQQELDHESRQRIKVSKDKRNIENRLDGLLNLLPGGVVVLGRSGNVDQCNPAAVELLGDGLVGRSWGEVIDRCFAPRADDGHEISMVDGRRLSISTRSLESGKGQIILLTDQTETRELQDALARHERLSTMGKMVAYLAHQIRTPLSAAMLYGGHLSAGTLSKDKQMEFAAKLVKQHRHLEQQIKDLLIFARGEILYKQEAAVADILQDIKCSTELLITQSGLSCQFASDLNGARIQCNSESLVGAVVNLVNNAIEAANGNVRIRVTAMLAEHEGRPALVLSVEDDGPGICEENLSKVLEPFYTTKSKGTGLGLAVVQAVARSHDGTLLLESNEGEGTLASLMLPVIESVAGAPTVADDSA